MILALKFIKKKLVSAGSKALKFETWNIMTNSDNDEHPNLNQENKEAISFVASVGGQS